MFRTYVVKENLSASSLTNQRQESATRKLISIKRRQLPLCRNYCIFDKIRQDIDRIVYCITICRWYSKLKKNIEAEIC
jgi:hypothetical protein